MLGTLLGCAIFMLLLTSPIWVIVLKRRIQRWLLRSFENRTFSRATYRSASTTSVKQMAILPVATTAPFIAVVMFFILGMATSGNINVNVRIEAIVIIAGSIYVAAQLAQLIALYVHYSGTASRKAKYEWLMTGFAMSAFAGASGFGLVTGLRQAQADGIESRLWPSLIVVLTVVMLFYWIVWVTLQWSIYAVVRSLVRRHREAAIYYHFQSPWLFIIAFLLGPLLILYILFRFQLRPFVARRPIVYLRAFRNEKAPLVFGKIVAKAARRVGVLVGLAHRLQRASELQAGLEITELADFAVTPDESWQEWVIETLGRAAVVIVDATTESQSLAWEISQACQILGVNRVAIVAPAGSPELQSGVATFQYSAHRADISHCRMALRNWLRTQIAQVFAS